MNQKQKEKIIEEVMKEIDKEATDGRLIITGESIKDLPRLAEKGVKLVKKAISLAISKTEQDNIFINHIKNHLKEGEKVICKICGKSVEEIYEEELKKSCQEIRDAVLKEKNKCSEVTCNNPASLCFDCVAREVKNGRDAVLRDIFDEIDECGIKIKEIADHSDNRKIPAWKIFEELAELKKQIQDKIKGER